LPVFTRTDLSADSLNGVLAAAFEAGLSLKQVKYASNCLVGVSNECGLNMGDGLARSRGAMSDPDPGLSRETPACPPGHEADRADAV
jgi:hypothetical protein